MKWHTSDDTCPRRYCAAVEATLLDIRHIRDQREKAGVAGADSKALTKKCHSKSQQVRTLLKEREVTLQRAGVPVEPITEDMIKQLLAGAEAPWAGPQGAGPVSTLYHGRLLHAAVCEVERCKEEIAFVPIEVTRLQEWVAYMLGQVDVALTACACEEGFPCVPTLAVVAQTVVQCPSYGKWFCLMRWKAVLESMKNV
jgi:hypothetical protein